MASNAPTNRKSFFIDFIKGIFFFRKRKTHDFRLYQEGIDYSVDFLNFYGSARMITGINVKIGEYVILSDREYTLTYLAETVDYYWNSDSLREIGLKRILLESDD